LRRVKVRERIPGVQDALDKWVYVRLLAFQKIFEILSTGEVFISAVVGSARDHKRDFWNFQV
jgi:hypothetical protein